ncbi:Gluconate 2-dehydrogenase cytochrome c subunit [compost metagenome]
MVNGGDATSLIHILLVGGTLPSTHQRPSAFTMPPFDWRLSDQEVADIVTFIRGSWGNRGMPVAASQVGAIRAEVNQKRD